MQEGGASFLGTTLRPWALVLEWEWRGRPDARLARAAGTVQGFTGTVPSGPLRMGGHLGRFQFFCFGCPPYPFVKENPVDGAHPLSLMRHPDLAAERAE